MTRIQTSLLIAVLLTACAKDSAPGADAGPSKDSGQKATATPSAVSGPAQDAAGTTLGRIEASEHINLNALVNKTAAEVDAVLGSPSDTGSDRISCVRFVPKRVFFACEQEIRVYEHPQFEQIRVEFEDGRAAVVAISGLPGEGAFEPDAALASVGLVLPDAPHHDNPALGMGGEPGDVVDRWEWSNSRARLRIDGLEHRVRLSTVNGEWSRSKLEIIINHPLNDAQKAKIKPVRGAEPAAPEPEVSVGEPAN
ncbi:hypothetical protein [Enhygromyxa salina]|uniref:hypothetical protein n=1 Tax=Enhygromyxa salina TaxID=215803 RepID=UPI0011B1D016|nr:hypothetical protein [Enhygromyxa salina]